MPQIDEGAVPCFWCAPSRLAWLQRQGQSGDHELHSPAHSGDFSIQQALGITKIAAHAGFWNQAHADFVGNEDDRAGGIGNSGGERLGVRANIAALMQAICQPKCEAIDDDDSVGSRLCDHHFSQINGRLDGPEIRAPLASVALYALGHLGIQRGGSGDEDPFSVNVAGKLQGPVAFA